MLSIWGMDVIDLGHGCYRFGARMLEPVIRKQHKIQISHNRIHMYLKAQGLAQDNQKKQLDRRKKWLKARPPPSP
jgi:putative transposase